MSLIIRSSFGLMLLSSITLFAMQANEYTVGIKFPTETCKGLTVNPLHVTLTFLGAADEQKLDQAKESLKKLHEARPIEVKIGEEATFGTQERPVKVRRLEIINPEIKSILIEMHQRFGVCEPGQSEKLLSPNWHVAVGKVPGVKAELASKVGAIVTLGKIFIRPLGPKDPIFELDEELATKADTASPTSGYLFEPIVGIRHPFEPILGIRHPWE